MKALDDLAATLVDLDRKPYRAYKTITGNYAAGRFLLHIDHVQGDPFAEASRLRATVAAEDAKLPDWAFATDSRRVSTADFLNRSLHRILHHASVSCGSGKSGKITILKPGQEVLRRTALSVSPTGEIEARFRAGLPAAGRRILGEEAASLLTRTIPNAIEDALFIGAIDEQALREQVEVVEDARALRAALVDRKLISFVGNGASLARSSGVDDRPLGKRSVPFRSPPELEITLDTPHAGKVTGMGISNGVNLIVGGGYHGKSTLLRAVERGIYDHIPGDGRERVVTVETAVKVRAEDGRHVAGADISNFIRNLPNGQQTKRFETENASGSTSQATAIIEALEVGASCLLVDEDTSATNFMIRDARMQALIADGQEPIVPFIDRVRTLADKQGVSTVVVVGGSGDYFEVADTVIAMHAYKPEEVTARAKEICRADPTQRSVEGGSWSPIAARIPIQESLDPSRGRREIHIKAWAEDRVLYGDNEVDLRAVEQITETAQLRAMANALAWAHENIVDGKRSLTEIVGRVMTALNREGLDRFQDRRTGDLAEFRRFELAAFLGRIRGLRVALGPKTGDGV